MKLTTKTITSLLLTTAFIPHVGSRPGGKQSQFERILQKHDRKGELRSDILGMSPLEFRDQYKKQPFEELIRQHGFKSEALFRLALFGKLRDELMHRGWSRQRIDRHVMARNERMQHSQNVV